MSLLKKAFVCGGVLLALAACEHGDPVSTAGGERGHGILLNGTPLSSTLPGGSAYSQLTFNGFDNSIRDWLGRKPTNATVARRTRNFTTTTSQFWYWTDEFRDGNPERLDPRTPVPAASTASAPDFELYQPNGSYPNKEFWELYVDVRTLKASTPYQIAFVHHRLTVNGQVDHVERVMTGTVTQPDQLTPLAGTPGIVNTDWSSASPTGCAPFPGATTNPFIASTDPSDANGRLNVDKCWLPGNGIWNKADFGKQPQSMVGRSDDTTYTLPNYNYIELWEGVYGTGTLVGRIQIAQDLDPAGVPVKDAYPPFPAPEGYTEYAPLGPVPTVDKWPSFPISDSLKSVLPGAGNLVLPPSRVITTLRNIQRLTTPVYKAWFMNGVTGAAKPAVGRYIRKVGTATVEDVASTSTFKGGPGIITFDASYSTSPAVHGPYSDSLNFLVFTKEDNAAATTPNLSQPLWVKIFRFPPSTAGGALAFGNFNRDTIAAGRAAVVFTPQGIAAGGVLGDTSSILVPQPNGTSIRQTVFVGSKVEMKFSNLQRPPKGYQYVGYLRNETDTTLVYVGPLTGVAGESLEDADVAPRSSNLGPQGIATSRLNFDAQGLGGLCIYDRFRLYLVAKGGDATAPTVLIFDMPLPGKVTSASSCRSQ